MSLFLSEMFQKRNDNVKNIGIWFEDSYIKFFMFRVEGRSLRIVTCFERCFEVVKRVLIEEVLWLGMVGDTVVIQEDGGFERMVYVLEDVWIDKDREIDVL